MSFYLVSVPPEFGQDYMDMGLELFIEVWQGHQ